MILLDETGFDFEKGRKDEDWPEYEQIAEAAVCEHEYGDSPWTFLDAP